eukprot:10450612-Alexandrium_andersonii.AAC.1
MPIDLLGFLLKCRAGPSSKGSIAPTEAVIAAARLTVGTRLTNEVGFNAGASDGRGIQEVEPEGADATTVDAARGLTRDGTTTRATT